MALPKPCRDLEASTSVRVKKIYVMDGIGPVPFNDLQDWVRTAAIGDNARDSDNLVHQGFGKEDGIAMLS